MASDGGKGSAPRPFSVANEEYANRWDAIFSRDIEAKEKAKEALRQSSENEYDRLKLYEKDDGPLTKNQLNQLKSYK
jgi:hypothetical protein